MVYKGSLPNKTFTLLADISARGEEGAIISSPLNAIKCKEIFRHFCLVFEISKSKVSLFSSETTKMYVTTTRTGGGGSQYVINNSIR